jgi:2,4-dienoyl-CoA reductase-like NADH-dependent reductase (Old Yellow Enzyme family)
MTVATTESLLGTPISLPCGAVLSNRFAKAAMTEQMAGTNHAPHAGHVALYKRWGQSGAGLLISGNVMVDGAHLEHVGNVVAEDERHMDMLTKWADAAQAEGAHLWMQISHPGRQCPKTVNRHPVAPSEVTLKGLEAFFSKPRALKEDEIESIIQRFVRTARIAKQAGFKGVQMHSAHGYLSSQFLSPLANKRTDKWGGSLENRMRFLLAVINGMRQELGPEYPIGVKLNSADFQRGGFSEEESMEVVKALEEARIDLLEISGGSYENPAMVGQPGVRASTASREAFFLEYAEKIRGITKLPLMLTGGFRTAEAMNNALASGAIDVIGLARPFCVDPDLPKRILAGEMQGATSVNVRVGLKLLDDMMQTFWYCSQMRRMAAGIDPDPKLGRYGVLLRGLAASIPKPFAKGQAEQSAAG